VEKAIGRRAGGVTGDGRSSVARLVEQAMAERGKRAAGSVVKLDDEAHELLAERGMSPLGVPAEGEFIALRRRANMSTGGTSRDVLPGLHPDNARLAIRAAQALRLDLAGIDLIIPDIAVSWLDTTAAICEVNAQPQISTEFAPEVYRDLLRRMVREPVRLRAVLVLDAGDGSLADGAVIAAAQALAQDDERVLSVRSDGRWLADERVAPPHEDAFAAAVGAELETEASALVAALTPAQVLRAGAPWLHIDEVRVVGMPGSAGVGALHRALALIAPHVAGRIVIDAPLRALLGPTMPGACLVAG
jgi:cyanophycin synthetase